MIQRMMKLLFKRLLIAMFALTVSFSSLPLFTQSASAQSKQPSYSKGISKTAEVVRSVNFRDEPALSGDRIRYLRVRFESCGFIESGRVFIIDKGKRTTKSFQSLIL
jgi:hypothetical protein